MSYLKNFWKGNSMIVKIIRLLLLAFLLAAGTAMAQSDVEGSKDHPMFTRMPSFFIEDYQTSDFDSNLFIVSTKVEGDWEEKSVEGRKTTIWYTLQEGAKGPSSLQIIRNYQKAAEKISGKKLYENDDPGARRLTMMVPGGGKETWLQVESSGPGGYVLTIIEKGDLKQEVTATDMLDAINKDGHVALYINFDTGMATIKPDSAPIIDQIAAMMKSVPALKLAVEGHTDNVGDAKKNKKLSEDRANAVVQAIAEKGIDKSRMSAAGFGAEKPVGDNKAETGRAKNRRVELVKR